MSSIAGFGARLVAAREGSGATQEQLAVSLGVSVATVSRWERELVLP